MRSRRTRSAQIGCVWPSLGWAISARILNSKAAQIAREARDVAGGRDVLVFGSIGPLQAPVHGPERPSEAQIREAFREQIEGLLEGGADVLLFETFSDLDELLLGVAEARSLSDLPIVAQMTFGEELVAIDGIQSSDRGDGARDGRSRRRRRELRRGSADQHRSPRADGQAVLRPCSLNRPQRRPAATRRAASSFTRRRRLTSARRSSRFLDAGARIIGGCCGTTPEHIRHMRAALDGPCRHGGRTARAPAHPQRSPRRPAHADLRARRQLQRRSRRRLRDSRRCWPETLRRQRRDRPAALVRIERTIEAARLLQDAGVDVVNISDSAMARVRMGALAVAFGIQHDLDLECIVHFTTRDRNLMALESELLGAHALGVRDILALTGDPPRVGDYPTGTGIWDVDSIGLIGILARLNRGEDQAGKPIGAPAGFTIACALDPTRRRPRP